MLVTLGPGAMISDLNILSFDAYVIYIVLDHICKLYTHVVVRNRRPRSDNNRDNRRGWLRCEDHVCSRSVNALLRCSIKRSTLITSSFPRGPAATGWLDKRWRASFSLRARATKLEHTPMVYLFCDAFIILAAMPCIAIICSISSMQRPTSIPVPTVFPSYCLPKSLLLLFLLFYCCYFATVTTTNLLLLINLCK